MNSPGEELRDLLSAYWVSQALSVAAELGLADLLHARPQTAEELATQVGADPDALYRLLRALASQRVFTESTNGEFHLTAMAELLRTDHPQSQRSAARMRGGWQYRTWGNLLDSVRTGKPAFEQMFGKKLFEYMQEEPQQAQLFDEAMLGIHGRETAGILAAYDFSQVGTVVDVGGGSGTLLLAILDSNHNLHGTLFDLPSVVVRSKSSMEDRFGARLCFVGGSFLEEVPSGGEIYILRHILHDWTDEDAATILSKVREAIPKNGVLLIIETIISPGNEPSFGKLLDLNMLVLFGGRERTETQYRQLLEQARFRTSCVIASMAEVSIIEARPF